MDPVQQPQQQTPAPEPPPDWRIEIQHTIVIVAGIAGLTVLAALGRLPAELAGLLIAGASGIRPLAKNLGKRKARAAGARPPAGGPLRTGGQ